MNAPKLVVVTDTEVARGTVLVERVERIVRAARPGTVLVQLRDREIPARVRLALGRELARVARAHGQLFGVNDRVDLAVLLDADVLHLGETSVIAADARPLVDARVKITRACHDPDLATPDGADGIVLSPIVKPRKGNAALGFEGLRTARRAAGDAWLFALGGVDAGTAAACLGAGADGVATIGAAIGVDDAGALLDALGIGWTDA